MHKFIFQRLRKSLIFDPGIIQSRYESIQTEIRKHLDVYTNQLKVWINPGTHCSFRNPERFRIQRPVVRVGRGEHRDEDTWRRTSCSFGKNSWPSVPLVGSYTRSTLPGRVREKVFDPFLQWAVRTIGSERLRHLVRHQEPHATSPTSSSSRVVRADPRQGRRHRFESPFESTICFQSTFHDGKFVECRPIRRNSKVVTRGWTVGLWERPLNRRAETWHFELGSRTKRIFEGRKRLVHGSLFTIGGRVREWKSKVFHCIRKSGVCIDNKCRIREKKVKVKEIWKKI